MHIGCGIQVYGKRLLLIQGTALRFSTISSRRILSVKSKSPFKTFLKGTRGSVPWLGVMVVLSTTSATEKRVPMAYRLPKRCRNSCVVSWPNYLGIYYLVTTLTKSSLCPSHFAMSMGLPSAATAPTLLCTTWGTQTLETGDSATPVVDGVGQNEWGTRLPDPEGTVMSSRQHTLKAHCYLDRHHEQEGARLLAHNLLPRGL